MPLLLGLCLQDTTASILLRKNPEASMVAPQLWQPKSSRRALQLHAAESISNEDESAETLH